MKKSISILLLFSYLFISSFTCYAEDTNSDDFGKFTTFYYLNPQPQRLPVVLKNFLNSEMLSDEQTCDDYCKEICSYFFARAARSKGNIIGKYQSLFESGTHKQRLFVLKILQLCGNNRTKMFLKSKLKDQTFAGEKTQIQQALQQGVPTRFNPISKPITEAGNLDLLWVEFMTTGNSKAIKRIISVLHWLEDGKGMQIIIAGAAKWSLTSNCKQHKKVLEICKRQWSEQRWPTKKILREIVAEVDNSAIADYLADKKMKKIVTRNITPGVEKEPFSTLPLTSYLFSDKYGRIEEQLDEKLQLQGLIIINTPDIWMVNLRNKTGKHLVDFDPNSSFHSPIISGLDTKDNLSKLEYGQELEFMKKNNAQVSQIEIEKKNYDLYSLEMLGTKIELIVKKVKQVPHIVRVFKDQKIILAIAYDEYNTNLKPDLSLFDPPEDIKIVEVSTDPNQATEHEF